MKSRTASVMIFLCIFSLLLLHVKSTEFEVGDDKGWQVPSSKDPLLYNEWARKNRFKVNDTLKFRYKKDSVMEVTEAEYEKCRSFRPVFFSNAGDTTVALDRPGLFYFISGVSGHCQKGMKMAVKVRNVESSTNDDQQSDDGSRREKNGANDLLKMRSVASFPNFVVLMIMGVLVRA